MPLRLACLLAPGPQTVAHAQLAESLGYDRVWLADSPALWQDIWARMALVAAQTHRIQLGTAVLIPSLRHVVTQAAAIATIADIAPGRLTVRTRYKERFQQESVLRVDRCCEHVGFSTSRSAARHVGRECSPATAVVL